MLIFAHVVAAISGLAIATFALFSPSHIKLKVTYLLTAFTLASGTYLVIFWHAQLWKSCLSGLAYIGIIVVEVAYGRRKLSKVTALAD